MNFKGRVKGPRRATILTIFLWRRPAHLSPQGSKRMTSQSLMIAPAIATGFSRHAGRGRPMKPLHRPLATLLVLCWATAAHAFDTTPVSDPEALGFSSSRLARIAAWQQSQVDAGAFSGAVAAIARNGRVAYLRAAGVLDDAKTITRQPEPIFWTASLT